MSGTDSAFRVYGNAARTFLLGMTEFLKGCGEQIVGVPASKSVEQFVALVDVSFPLFLKER